MLLLLGTVDGPMRWRPARALKEIDEMICVSHGHSLSPAAQRPELEFPWRCVSFNQFKHLPCIQDVFTQRGKAKESE